MDDWSEGLNSIITCVKIRGMGSSVTPIEKDMTGGGYREKKRNCTERLGRSSERIQLKVRLTGDTRNVVLQSLN